MTGCLDVRRRAGTHTQGRWRWLAAAVLVLPFLVGTSPDALANREQQHDEQRDGQSRHEGTTLRMVPLVTADRRYVILQIAIVQSGGVWVAPTSPGVEVESLDRVDVSGVPVLGGLFGRPLQAGDLTDENRVGTVYQAGDGTLAAVVDERVDVAGSTVSVVNGKGQYKLSAAPQPATGVPGQLGDFGSLRSVQTTIAGTAPRDTVIMLGGHSLMVEPTVESGVPVLDDLPVLNRLFRGTVHQRDERTLLMLVKPTILIQKEQE